MTSDNVALKMLKEQDSIAFPLLEKFQFELVTTKSGDVVRAERNFGYFTARIIRSGMGWVWYLNTTHETTPILSGSAITIYCAIQEIFEGVGVVKDALCVIQYKKK